MEEVNQCWSRTIFVPLTTKCKGLHGYYEGATTIELECAEKQQEIKIKFKGTTGDI